MSAQRAQATALICAVMMLARVDAAWAATLHSTPATFTERIAVRRHFTSTARGKSPWPDPLALHGIRQIVARKDGKAWVIENQSGNGGGGGGGGDADADAVWMLQLTDPIRTPELKKTRATVSGVPLDLSPGSRVAVLEGGANGGASDVLVCAERERLRWLVCPQGSAECELRASADGPHSDVLSVSIDTNTGAVWMGTQQGLAWSSAIGDAARMLPNVTTDAVVAVATGGGYVAAATTVTLYWGELGNGDPTRGRWTHLGVGGVIDPFITTLHFVWVVLTIILVFDTNVHATAHGCVHMHMLLCPSAASIVLLTKCKPMVPTQTPRCHRRQQPIARANSTAAHDWDRPRAPRAET